MNLVDKLVLGTVQFGLDYGISNERGKTSAEEVQAIFDFAASKGITTLDTAQAYGTSEDVIGNYNGVRFEVVTKIAPTGSESVRDLVQKSLDRLRLEKLYGVLFHNATSALQNPFAFKELEVLKQKGKIEKIGFSVYNPDELEKLIQKIGVPDLIQIPYSHLDRRFEEIADKLHVSSVEIHTRSTFLQGLFFMKPDRLSSFFDPVKPYLKELSTLFKDPYQIAGFLLHFVVTRPFIDKVVIGVNNLEQLKLNISGLVETNEALSLAPPPVPREIILPYLWK